MANDETNTNGELDSLLPLYINGGLSSEESARVEVYLKENPEAQRDLDFLRNVKNGIKETPFPNSPGMFGYKRLEQRIAQEKAPVANNDNQVAVWWRPVGIAASLLAAVFAVFILQQNIAGSGPGDVHLASGEWAVEGPVLQIIFKPDTSERSIRSALMQMNARFIDGPSALGIYRLEILTPEITQSDIEALLDDIRRQSVIISIEAE